MKITDYFLLRTPEARMGRGSRLSLAPSTSGKIPPLRVSLSLLGIILGIVASFYVTGINQSKPSRLDSSTKIVPTESAATASPSTPQVATGLRGSFLKTCLVSLVICLLTYPGLYFTLHLYANQAAFLIFFVSFQYGYFWQSAVQGGKALLA